MTIRAKTFNKIKSLEEEFSQTLIQICEGFAQDGYGYDKASQLLELPRYIIKDLVIWPERTAKHLCCYVPPNENCLNKAADKKLIKINGVSLNHKAVNNGLHRDTLLQRIRRGIEDTSIEHRPKGGHPKFWAK